MPVLQLPLALTAARQPSFDNFVAGSNAEALERVRSLACGNLTERIVYLWGEPGSGRSHLLAAAARVNPHLVIADDVEALDAAAQHSLFIAINAAREGEDWVLAAGNQPPARLELREDLRTRLGWGLVYQLNPLTDAEKAVHLRAEAARRGIVLSEEVLHYLLSRAPRDLATLHAILNSLDRESLAGQRPVTVPLVRETLSKCDDG